MTFCKVELKMKIYDGFLAPRQVWEIEQTAKNLPWSFSPGSVRARPDDPIVPDHGYDSPQFVHVAYDNGKPQSEYFEFALHIFDSWAKANKIPYVTILRAKFNIVPKVCEIGVNQPAHVDFEFPHNVFLYYLNDSDGETIIFNELFNGSMPNELTEAKRVPPVAGTAVVFNGLHYHAPTPPTINPYRIVLNVPFIGWDK